jgi:hypothetical protein
MKQQNQVNQKKINFKKKTIVKLTPSQQQLIYGGDDTNGTTGVTTVSSAKCIFTIKTTRATTF